MKQSKFSLADVITVLTALAFGYVCFLGMNFYTMGNTSQSITLSVVITLLLSGTAFGAKLFKRADRKLKTNFILEMLMLTLFTGLMIFFAYSPFPHYFVVSEKKEEITNKLVASISQAENMFAEYEYYAENRMDLYESKLKSVAASKVISLSEYSNYGFVSGSVSDKKQLENKMFTIHAELFPSNYSDTTNQNGIKETAMDWLAKAKRTTVSWKPIGIVEVVNDVEQNSQNWLNQLVALSQVRQAGEKTTDFEHSLLFDDVKDYFTILGAPTPFSIGLAMAAYVLMLFSWFRTERSPKAFGKLASYEVEL